MFNNIGADFYFHKTLMESRKIFVETIRNKTKAPHGFIDSAKDEDCMLNAGFMR